MKATRTRTTRNGSMPINGYRSFLDTLSRSADGVFAVDSDQRIVYWSASAAELLGKGPKEVLGKYCHEIIRGDDYEGHPFCRPNCPTVRAARQGHPVANYDIAPEDGSSDSWLNISIVPLPETRPGEPLAVHLVRDVSKRRRSEMLAQAAIATVAQFMSDGEGTGDTRPFPAPGPSLTAREVEVLRLLAEGFGTESLAEKLGLREVTVRNHIQRLLAKLGVHSRLEAVVYGAQHGLI